MDVNIEFDILGETGEGEIAGAYQRNRRTGASARMGDIRLGMKFPPGVNAALDFSFAKTLNNRLRA